MSIVASGMPLPDGSSLELQIRALRSDGILRDAITRAKEALRERLAFSSGPEALPQYENVIKSALHHLATNHLQPFFRAEMENELGVAVLSYSSRYAGRVADFLSPDPLNDPGRTLSTHVGAVIEQEWKQRLSLIPGMFELHRLAQCRINLSGSPPTRVPIYLSATAPPLWLDDYNRKRAPGFLIEPTGNDVDAALFELGDSDDEGDLHKRFVEFVTTYSEAEETQGCYPPGRVESAGYVDYLGYLKKLLVDGPRSLCLCTVAISDELSNVPLGTAMLFTTVPSRPVTAGAVHAVCFELFNALHMIEARADERQKTASMVAHWVHHEAQHWSTQMKGIAACLSPAPDEDTDDGETPMAPAEHSSLAAELSALAGIVPMTTELLKQLSEDIRRGVGPQTFTVAINTIFRAIADQDGYKTLVNVDGDWSGDGNIPNGLIPVALELIRNAVRHRGTTGGNKRIAVELKGRGQFLHLVVTCEPQLRENIKKLEYLNSTEPTDQSELGTEVQLTGTMLVKRIIRVLGGKVEWQPRHRADGQLVVAATCSIPLPDAR